MGEIAEHGKMSVCVTIYI